MALDMLHQALPDECALLEAARTDPAAGGRLQFLPAALARGASDEDAAFAALAAAHPHLVGRSVSLDRDWDKLHWLLSPLRRESGATLGIDLGTWAVHGAHDLGPYAKGTQGTPLRHSRAHEVVAIARGLDAIDRAGFFAHYDAAAMEAGEVYKHWADRDSPDARAALWSYFEALRAFYRAAATDGLAVLVVLD